jgi:recombination protein RecR
MQYPEVIQKLISNFSSLPGIGGKTAERLVFYILKNKRIDLSEFGQNLSSISELVKNCSTCGNYKLNDHCQICDEPKRDKSIICTVAEVQDIYYLDKTHSFNGMYHVLNGLIIPADGMTPDKLNIATLLKRIESNGVNEVILGFNPTVEGESTIIYLKKKLKEKKSNLKITRLSRGLPMGGDLEYADEVTLSSAINNRSEV